jgi:hypothetical protein
MKKATEAPFLNAEIAEETGEAAKAIKNLNQRPPLSLCELCV